MGSHVRNPVGLHHRKHGPLSELWLVETNSFLRTVYANPALHLELPSFSFYLWADHRWGDWTSWTFSPCWQGPQYSSGQRLIDELSRVWGPHSITKTFCPLFELQSWMGCACSARASQKNVTMRSRGDVAKTNARSTSNGSSATTCLVRIFPLFPRAVVFPKNVWAMGRFHIHLPPQVY